MIWHYCICTMPLVNTNSGFLSCFSDFFFEYYFLLECFASLELSCISAFCLFHLLAMLLPLAYFLLARICPLSPLTLAGPVPRLYLCYQHYFFLVALAPPGTWNTPSWRWANIVMRFRVTYTAPTLCVQVRWGIILFCRDMLCCH